MFYVPLDTKQVTLETFFQPNPSSSTGETKSTSTKANIHREYKNTITQKTNARFGRPLQPLACKRSRPYCTAPMAHMGLKNAEKRAES